MIGIRARIDDIRLCGIRYLILQCLREFRFVIKIRNLNRKAAERGSIQQCGGVFQFDIPVGYEVLQREIFACFNGIQTFQQQIGRRLRFCCGGGSGCCDGCCHFGCSDFCS